MSVCTWSSPCQEQSKLVEWISRTISERQESIVEKEWSLWFSLYIAHMVWILTSYNTSGVLVGCALSCIYSCIRKSLQDNWGRQKAVVLTDRCEKIEPLRLHPWIRRFGRALMQAVGSSWLDASALHPSSKDQHWEVERMPQGCRPFPAASNAR